ncbi:MAG: hypothetical protein ACJ8G4_12520 [Burkholderiales bacterium]
MKIVFALLIALGTAGAAAQSPSPQTPATPASQPAEQKAAPARSLNLNLDDASLRQITRTLRDEPVEGKASGASGALPGLGDGARRIEPGAVGTRSSPYPKDNDPVR